jgi:hypothetical protein
MRLQPLNGFAIVMASQLPDEVGRHVHHDEQQRRRTMPPIVDTHGR